MVKFPFRANLANVVGFTPPLIITQNELARAVDAVTRQLAVGLPV